jgi:hypothetical protein
MSIIGSGIVALRKNDVSNNLLNLIDYYYHGGATLFYQKFYLFNNVYYICWTTNRNDLDGYVCTLENNVFSDSVLAREGETGDCDAHYISSMILDDSGYIFVARQLGDTDTAPYNIIVNRSDAPEDISAFSLFQNIEDGNLDQHTYCTFGKVGSTIYMIARSNLNRFKVFKLTDGGASFDSGYNFVQLSDPSGQSGKEYKLVLNNSDENKLGLVVMFNDNTETTNCFVKVGYVETTDGITWSNMDGTYSKNIVTNGEIDYSEFETNCMLYKADNWPTTVNGEHFMAIDGFIYNSNPYFLMDSGKASSPAVRGSIDYDNLRIIYYDGEFVRVKSVPTSISRLPEQRDFRDRQLYHFTHDGQRFVMFVISDDKKSVNKWISSDLDSWTDLGRVMHHDTYEFCFLQSPYNDNKRLLMALRSTDGSYCNLLVHCY